MPAYKISLQAIEKAARAAGPRADAVRRVLYEDIGRPLPPPPSAVKPRAGEPFSSYHTLPKYVADEQNALQEEAARKPAVPNAQVEGADAPRTVPDTEGELNHDP